MLFICIYLTDSLLFPRFLGLLLFHYHFLPILDIHSLRRLLRQAAALEVEDDEGGRPNSQGRRCVTQGAVSRQKSIVTMKVT